MGWSAPRLRRLVLGVLVLALAITAVVLNAVREGSRHSVASGFAGIASAAPVSPQNVARAVPKRILFVGASYTAGVGAVPQTNGYAYLTAKALGWQLRIDAVPGSGYLNPGPPDLAGPHPGQPPHPSESQPSGTPTSAAPTPATQPSDNQSSNTQVSKNQVLNNQPSDGAAQPENGTFADRLATLSVSPEPDILVLQGGRNDSNYPPSQLHTAVQHTVDVAKGRFSHARIVLLGPIPAALPPDHGEIEVEHVLREVARTSDVDFVDPIAEGWITMANERGYVGDVPAHPDNAGYAYISKRLVEDLDRLLGATSQSSGGVDN